MDDSEKLLILLYLVIVPHTNITAGHQVELVKHSTNKNLNNAKKLTPNSAYTVPNRNVSSRHINKIDDGLVYNRSKRYSDKDMKTNEVSCILKR